MPFQLAVQRMTFPAWPLHILKSNRIIQNIKLHSEACRVFRLDAGLRSRFKETLNALVPETLDHTNECIPERYAIRIYFDVCAAAYS